MILYQKPKYFTSEGSNGIRHITPVFKNSDGKYKMTPDQKEMHFNYIHKENLTEKEVEKL